jgi:hypothetical protein
MMAKRANPERRVTRGRWLFPVLVVCVGACSDAGLVQPAMVRSDAVVDGGRSEAVTVLTGTLDLVWPGGRGAGAPDEDRMAQAEIAAFAGVASQPPGPGTFYYRVLAADGSVHREIGVELTWVGLEDQELNPGEVRFIGVVVSDTKPCGGSGHGSGDDGGCSHDDGGCTHDDGTTHDDGGCTHDDGTTHDDGGCTHDDGTTHDDGACSGGGDTGGHGEPGGPGGHGGGVNGSDCRIGQIVIGWALDGGTPALNGDRVSWKWMAPDAPKVLAIQAAIEGGLEIPWPCKLCEKVILGGNLRLRLRR